MSIITLTSDYGTADHRVAAIKGTVLSMKADASIVDISHAIPAYNLQQTAYVLRNSYHYFPKGSVHIISVDSFYRRERRAVLYVADGHYFIAADNGLLSLIFLDIVPDAVYEITFNNRFDDEVRFTSTDIFVPAAVHLINGGLPEIIGRKITDPKELALQRAGSSDNMIVGEIMYFDNFGNAVTNISRRFFEKSMKGYTDFTITFRHIALKTIRERYTDVVTDWDRESEFHGHSSAIFNESGLLELTIYKGNKNNGAKTLFGLRHGDNIIIEFT